MLRTQSLATLFIALAAVACTHETTAATEPTDNTPVATATSTPTAEPVATATATAAATAAPASDGPKAVPVDVPPAIAAIVAAPDRSADDRALDAGRHPGEMLAFFGIAPGQKIEEVGAGGGYTSELLARAVGPTGKVYGQNPKLILEKFAEKPWSERLKKPVMKNVVRVDREFDSPIAPGVKDLDGVVVVLFYHDLYWMNADRAKMNKAVFDALKPGGFYGIIDHSAKKGDGSSATQTLHRIEESTVREDVEKAGFKLDREGFFLRNPDDTKDWSSSPSAAGEKRGSSDRFVLVFKKP
ncbi:MAG TPA: SAM-dependent methyltransferase [Polyangiaceae bacterium]|nr:SAM-dependent methyltransferase [Polyangiaceae bacterium]